MPTTWMLTMVIVGAAFSLFAHPLGAQTGALANAKRIKCTFSLISSSTLREEPAKAEIKPANLVLEFESINADEGSAQLKAGFGQYDIVVRYTQGYLHFIQSFRDGPLYVTTVLDQKTKAGKLKAMHSRHEYTIVSLPGYTSSPEQYYGECEILN